MFVHLPQIGRLPKASTFDPGDVLGGSTVTGWTFEVYDKDDSYLGTLDSVKAGGSLKWSSTQAIHSSGSIAVDDIGADIDWLNWRVKPIIALTNLKGETTNYAKGLYLCAAPTETWTEQGRSWDVELTDKLGVLDQDTPKYDSGLPKTFGATAGDNALDLVRQLIEQAGEEAPALGHSDETIQTDLTFEPGTRYLKIINELLKAAGFFSLSCDGEGQYRAVEYVSPGMRVPKYTGSLNPFSSGGASLMRSDFTRDQDIYSIPNLVYGTVQGDDESEGMTSVATVDDPDSPYSAESRGRTILDSDSPHELEATSQAALDAQVQMVLSQKLSLAAKYDIKHAFLPNLAMNDALMLHTADEYGGFNVQCYVSTLEMAVDLTGECTSGIHEAVI